MPNGVSVVGGLGGAKESDVLQGVTYSSDEGVMLTGTLVQDDGSALEQHIADKSNPHEVTAQQSAIQETTKELLEASFPNAESGLLALYLKLKWLMDKFDASTSEYSWLEYVAKFTQAARKDIDLSNTSLGQVYSAEFTFHYSNEIGLDSNGNVVLVNPSTKKHTAQINYGNQKFLDYGVYFNFSYHFITPTGNTAEVYRTESIWVGCDADGPNGWTSTLIMPDGRLFIESPREIKKGMTFIGTVTSTDPNAYPDKEWVGDRYYEQLPSSISKVANLETGSYCGTNGYGENNPNVLTFSFAPKIIFLDIYSGATANSIPLICSMLSTTYTKIPVFKSPTTDSMAKLSEDGKTVTWYGSTADKQSNVYPNMYHYIAIG